MASVAEILLILVSNQTPMELEVGRAGGRGIVNVLRSSVTLG